MTETANLSYQEVKEILAIFFDLPVGKIKCIREKEMLNTRQTIRLPYNMLTPVVF